MSYYRDEAPPRERTSQHYYRDERRDERRDDRDPRYVETRETFLRVHPSRDLVPRSREDSDLSVEEIRRDFPPPGYRQGDVQRARSADPRYMDDYDDRRSHYSKDRYDRDRERDFDRRDKKGTSIYYEEEERKKRRMLTKQEKIIAALVGGALVVGGKELYDRRDAKKDGKDGSDVHRNPMSSAALGAAGALAAYQGADFYNKHANKEEQKSTHIIHKGRDGKVLEYYSDDDGGTSEKKGNKNFLESALAAAGLGGAVKALTGRDDDKDRDKDKRSDTRSRRGSRSRSRSKSPGKADPSSRIQKAAMASLIAGATEAFRVAKKPGGWQGEKAKRVFTAAVGAATIDAATNQNSEKSSKLGLAESVIGGLLGNRVLNGSKKNIEEDRDTGRSRSRSRARSQSRGGGGGAGGLAALATAGLGALGAKKIMENRDKSRSPSRSRRRSADSWDSRDGSPRRKRSRSRSVVDSARRSLAKIGIGKGPDDEDSTRGSTSRRHNDFIDDDYPQGRDRGSGRRDRDYDDDRRSLRGGGRDRSRSRQRGGRRGSFSGSETDLGDSSEDEKQARRKKDRHSRH